MRVRCVACDHAIDVLNEQTADIVEQLAAHWNLIQEVKQAVPDVQFMAPGLDSGVLRFCQRHQGHDLTRENGQCPK